MTSASEGLGGFLVAGCMGKIALAVVAAASMLPMLASAKGEGVGLWMEGTVSNVEVGGQDIRLVLTGRFWFEQYRGRERSIVVVDGRHGLTATIAQATPFFAMAADWRAGAIRGPGALLAIVGAAAQRGRSVKFEFLDARLAFGRDGSLTVVAGGVIRATDHDLR